MKIVSCHFESSSACCYPGKKISDLNLKRHQNLDYVYISFNNLLTSLARQKRLKIKLEFEQKQNTIFVVYEKKTLKNIGKTSTYIQSKYVCIIIFVGSLISL